jgi:choline dehydrogenase-like flavoprotein
MWNVVREFPRSLATPASIFVRRYLARRKLPGVFLHSPENRYALHFHAEQQPHPDNRMELAPDGESLRIHYSLTEDDVQSVIRTHELLDAQLRRSSCGALEYWYPREMLASKIQEMSRDGIHQSGTLRIGESAEIGVVDEDLLVFGTRNLFVCSSAVFPTSGQANPTFFEGVFAVRLARSLRDGDALG